MNVQEIMNRDIIYVDKDVDLKYVIKLMKKHNITKIPVVENHKPTGLVTDSNIAKKLGAIRTRGVPAARLHASSVLDKDIEIISPLTKISDILPSVGEPGPTMLLVGTEDDLVGVVTKADLLPLVEDSTPLEEIMKQVVHHVSPEDRVIHARRQMIDADIARLPVVNNGILIGIISDIDVVYAIDKINQMDPDGLIDTIYHHQISMCGFGPVASLLHAAKKTGATSVELLKYGSSYDVHPDPTACVGYASFVIS